MKRIIAGLCCAFFLFTSMSGSVTAQERDELDKRLYATAAVLMDAQTGRVLYGKNGDEPMAMASTTKIMTCMIVLEEGDLEAKLQVSSYAASMPKVKLNIRKGETYRVKDLLYSLMLESHNDAAVALAEYIGKQYLSAELKAKNTSEYTVEESKQAVAAFALRMNAKASELGCENTYFITPNGLDATETISMSDGSVVQKEHHTTAAELARIMAYCIGESGKSELFLEITRTPNHSFSANGRNFSCVNHNAFLNMMEGALSGKTGFTNKAGYCYVGALERDGRTYTLALLACGWPNNKSYKWSDSKNLFSYGLEHYTYRDFAPEVVLSPIPVLEGAASEGNPFRSVSINVEKEEGILPIRLLTGETETVVAHTEIEKVLEAPVEEGTQVGTIRYYLIEEDGTEVYLVEESLKVADSVERINFRFIWEFILKEFLLCP